MTSPKKKASKAQKAEGPKSLEEMLAVKPLTPFMLPREIAKGKKPRPYFPATPPLNEEEIELTGRLFRNYLSRVFRAADCGDPEAIRLLIGVAFYTTDALELMARRFPERLRKYSRKHLKWPAFIGKKTILSGHLKPSRAGKKGGNQPLNTWLVDQLELSKDCPLGHNWQPQSPATQTAFCMLEWLGINQASLRLPPLHSRTRDLWFERGWETLLENTGGKPEGHEYLHQIGFQQGRTKYRRQVGYSAGQTRHERERFKIGSNAERGAMRDRIKSSLKQSFETLTQHYC